MSSVPSKAILIVEDHPQIGRELVRLLEQEGFTARLAPTLASARKAWREEHCDLVLLDVNLPDGLGFDLCRDIRDEDTSLPILFLTEKGDEDSVVKGLSFAATDYMRKPFARRELLMRLRRLLKLVSGTLTFGDLTIDTDNRRVQWQGAAIALSPREFEMLALLAANFGRLVTRARIAEQAFDADVNERSFNSYLSRLKTKLTQAGVNNIVITSVYGEGYRMEKA